MTHFGKALVSLLENKVLWNLGSHELRGILAQIALWLPLHFRKIDELESIRMVQLSLDLQTILKRDQQATLQVIKEIFSMLHTLSEASSSGFLYMVADLVLNDDLIQTESYKLFLEMPISLELTSIYLSILSNEDVEKLTLQQFDSFLAKLQTLLLSQEYSKDPLYVQEHPF